MKRSLLSHIEKSAVVVVFIGAVFLMCVVFVNAKEIYKQQSGETRVTLVILPGKKVKPANTLSNFYENPILFLKELFIGK